jgi:hypothetical protein
MSTKSKIKTNIKKRKTKTKFKSKQNTDIYSVNYYRVNFKDTEFIPKTPIINYIFLKYKSYVNYLKLCNTFNIAPLNFNECFIFSPDDIPIGLRKNDIQLNLQMNPKTPLDKLIAYCFYIKQSFLFEGNIEKMTKLIKYQIGKDSERNVMNINGKLYTPKDFQILNGNKIVIADTMYQIIIDNYYKYRKIDLNNVNKICLLFCQNLFNLITDMIVLQLNKVLYPEINIMFGHDKITTVNIKENELNVIYKYNSKLLISRDGAEIDIEYPCGYLEFEITFDLLNNNYKMNNLIIKYDIDKCGPPIDEENEDNEENYYEENKPSWNFKPEYVVPAGLLTAGIVTTPLLLTLLGGNKTTMRHKKKTKTRKIK